jgi:polysaccharide chain length determinant protein (PEP-CTERM system associated)
MDDHIPHPLDYLSVLRRRKWWFITPLVLSLAVGGALLVWLPRTYRSEAEIGIATPSLTPELLGRLSSLDQDERQRAITQQLLSKTVLERVVREEQLSPGKPSDDTAGWLRGRVTVSIPQPIGKGIENRNGPDSFKLGYEDGTPERAQRVTNRLASVFVEENSKTQISRSENTSEVLGKEVAESAARLQQIEDQLRRKKEVNMGRLPGQIEANISMLNGLRNQLESVSNQLRSEQDRLSMVESQIDAMKTGVGATAVTSATATAIQSAQARVATLQQELAQERALGHTDKHPDVIRVQQEIVTAKAELAARQQSPAGRDELLAADPAFKQKTAERDTARLRIATLTREDSQIRAQIGQYQSRVESAPMVEQDMAPLTREEELEKARYAELKNKHAAALSAESLTRNNGSERFSVLYPANLPTAPESPNLVLVMLGSLMAGLMLGSAGVVGREFLDRSVHDAQALQSEFEIPVLGEIPRIEPVPERAWLG